jgi:serine/threonine-protein kinase RsbW
MYEGGVCMYERGGKIETVVYGIKDIERKIDSIIDELNLKDECFGIRIILNEAITNAFIHGNKSDATKPICLKFEFENNMLKIEVKDCGKGLGSVTVKDKIDEDKILDENGRGLFLIKCYSDEVEFKQNSIIVRKCI